MSIHAERTSINELLGIPNRQLRIPPYQRPYAWEDEHVDELWDDIIATLDDGHFMGSIVLTGQRNQEQVIDGQQRLTTLALALADIRDRYASVKPSLVGSIQQFLSNQYAEGDSRYKLRTGDANWPVFRDFVLRAPDDPARRTWEQVVGLEKTTQARNERLIANARRIHDKIDLWINAGGVADAANLLERLARSILTKLEFVVISVPEVADAFVIFETLNDRGLALSAGDLLKNHLLQKAGESREDVEEFGDEWDDMLGSLQGGDVTRFLRHYLLIQNSRVLKEHVFGLFKKEVTKRGARPMMDEIKVMARWYGQFASPRTADEPKVRAVLADLDTLRATMCYSFLLAARGFPERIDADAFVALARLAETLTFRYSTICGKDSKELERAYHRAAKILWDSKGADVDGARQVLVEQLPTRDEFLAGFATQTMGRAYVVNYVMRRLEERLDDQEKRTRESGPVHIEHILPRTLNPAWVTVLGDRVGEHPQYVNRWGNLTLLGGRKNSGLSNKPFTEKRKVYDTSKILLTHRLAGLEQWGFDAIDARQRQLAEMADKAWAW